MLAAVVVYARRVGAGGPETRKQDGSSPRARAIRGKCDLCRSVGRLHPVPPDKWLCIVCLDRRAKKIQDQKDPEDEREKKRLQEMERERKEKEKERRKETKDFYLTHGL